MKMLGLSLPTTTQSSDLPKGASRSSASTAIAAEAMALERAVQKAMDKAKNMKNIEIPMERWKRFGSMDEIMESWSGV